MNSLHGFPLPGPKEVEKTFNRGKSQAVCNTTNTVIVWRDNKPVYMGSNCDELEPMGSCQHYSMQEKS